MQNQCPSCEAYYLYEVENAVCIDQYGECMNCMTNHGKNFSPSLIIEKAMFREQIASEVRHPDDWRNNIINIKKKVR